MPTLYVTEPGARVEKKYRRLQVVSPEDEVLLSAPLAQVSQVVLVGYAGVTTPALLALLDAGVGLTLVTRAGQLRGRLLGAQARNVPLRRLQYRLQQDEAFCLRTSRAIVQGKLSNCRTLAMRILRTLADPSQAASLRPRLEQIGEALQRLPQAANLEQLRGLEGNASRAYFAILRAGLRWQGQQPFERRNRRPPKDPVNALLSLGYTLLGDALFTALEVAGLDPYAGFFHREEYGRPALALDLVEEFRPVIVDSVMLSLVNKKMLQDKHFEPGQAAGGEAGEEGGVYLTRRGLRIFFQQYTRRLNTPILHPLAGRAIEYQKCFEVQARTLRKALEGGIQQYQPFLIK